MEVFGRSIGDGTVVIIRLVAVHLGGKRLVQVIGLKAIE